MLCCCCCCFSKTPFFSSSFRRLKNSKIWSKSGFSWALFTRARERGREKNPTTFSACLFGGGFESEQPPNANAQKYESSLSDANCHFRAPAIRFRFSPSRIGGNSSNLFDAIKKRFGCCLSVFLFPSPSRTNTKIFTKRTRKRFEARASTREQRNIKTNERVPGTFFFFTHKH